MSLPAPAISDHCKPYWDAVAAGDLRLQRCRDCRRWIHFPELACPVCGSGRLGFERVSGRGEIETFTEIHRSFVPGFEPPYIVAWIALPEQPGLRTLANIIDSDPAQVAIGRAVEFCVETRGDVSLPQFRLCRRQD